MVERLPQLWWVNVKVEADLAWVKKSIILQSKKKKNVQTLATAFRCFAGNPIIGGETRDRVSEATQMANCQKKKKKKKKKKKSEKEKEKKKRNNTHKRQKTKRKTTKRGKRRD